ncbi:MAG: TetR/AcrR family transcriptional regulator [Candidatus Didemnitutus sp.]|nr:TetR/AcrR family transcriptional regulator [Candidatus Didemnitutus sp.]
MNQTRRRAKIGAEPDGTSPWAGRRRRPRDHELKRDAVIRAAARAFNERGYHHTSLDHIAADLGVTKPTVYYYVANKEQLLFECFLAGLTPIRQALGDAERRGGTARDRLNEVIRGYAAAIASEYGWCMVRAHDQDLGPEMRHQINALKSEIDQGIRRLLRAGMDDGSIGSCDPKITAFALAGALNWIAHWYRADQALSATEVADAFVGFFEHGLRPRARATPPGRSERNT